MNNQEKNRGKKERVRSMFDAIAWRYDLLNRVLSLGIDISWRKKMIAQVARSGAINILDVATGTGDLAIMMAQKIPHVQVSGVDISEGMLAIARHKVARADLNKQITISEGDAESLSFAQGSFDAATIAFGVRNFEDIPLGIEQIYRTLKSGGGIYVLEFGIPHNKIFGAVYRFYFHRILPVMGRLVSKDREAYSYLPSSVDTFPYGEDFIDILSEKGFRECTCQNLFGGVAQIYYGKK